MSEDRTIAVATGSRAEYGLLRSVMRAIDEHPRLSMQVIVAGSHLLPPAETINEVAAEHVVAATIPMQLTGETGRDADAVALGRGISGFAERFAAHRPDVVLVLGDRIEPFAATAAAAVAGIRVAHMHGGDRAVGIADESLRHAISKLAHAHLVATAGSAERLINMGEEPLTVHLVGSPAIDDLDGIDLLPDDQYESLGRPDIVFLLHPVGMSDEDEWANAEPLLRLCRQHGPTLAMHPNHDPGREGIVEVIEASDGPHTAHLPRDVFIGLLRRVKAIVGNSSAGLIECAALGVHCINVGPRQAGRDMPPNVMNVPDNDPGDADMALERALATSLEPFRHPYGDGTAGGRSAEILASFNPEYHPIAKQNAY